MAFDFERLFPNAAKKKHDDKINTLLYIILVEWKWDYNTFLETPLPIIYRCLDKYSNIKKAEEKNFNKK